MSMSGAGLFDLVSDTFRRSADRPCLEVGEAVHSYGEVGREAGAIAALLADGPSPYVGILAARSRPAYTGLLGTLAAGRGFMPLNPQWPVQRLGDMVERSGVRDIVVDPGSLKLLSGLMEGTHGRMRLILPDNTAADVSADVRERHEIVDRTALPPGAMLPEASSARADDVAYLLFTSGTTGRPKGVPVTHRNIRAYLQAMAATEEITPDDRCSQFFDLTFDPSIHDIFITWMAGACLCVVPDHARIAPAGFIRDKKLTCWHSVPSVIVLLQRLGRLEPGSLPDLRLSRFAGEALPLDSARAWHGAAPHSEIENLYGPTECTIIVTRHRWRSADPERNGTVAIGRALAGVEAYLLSEDGTVVDGAGVGELVIAGDQVTGRYLDDPEQSAERFVELPGLATGLCYRTGDLVERDGAGTLVYLGRIDDQVQVQGNRVELAEVDSALRDVCGVPVAMTIAWPAGAPRVEALFAFVPEECDRTTAQIRSALRGMLPVYMVPERVFRIDEFPVNPNGKFDRAALARIAKERLESKS